MAYQNIYNDDDYRRFRISKILLDYGTLVLRKLLINKLKFSNLSLKEFLDNNKSQISKSKYFMEHERINLYPNNASCETPDKFDIGLCFKLIEFLGIEKDVLSRARTIKTIRNKQYAHIFRNSMSEEEFETIYKKLKSSLVNLCKSANIDSIEEQIKKCHDDPIDVSELVAYQNRLKSMFARDLEFNKLILEKMKDTPSCSYLKTLLERAEHNLNKDITKSIIEKFQEFFDDLKEKETDFLKLFEQVFDKMESITKKELNMLSQINKESEQRHIELKKDLNDIKEILEKKTYFEDMNNCFPININDFVNYFSEDSDFNFKILILSIDKEYYNKLPEEFFKIIAYSSWNLVIDLNPQEKMHNQFVQQTHSKKNFSTITFPYDYELIDQIRETERILIVENKHKCYIQANRILEPNDPDFLIFEDLNKKLSFFLAKIISHKHTIMCTNLIVKKEMNLSFFENVDYLNTTINLLISSPDEKLELIYLILEELQTESFTLEIKRLYNKRRLNAIKKCCMTTSAILIESLKSNYCLTQGDNFKLPAKNESKIEWTQNENTIYSPYFQVYHTEIGKCNFTESEIISKTIDFIIGNEITTELIYINDEYEGGLFNKFTTYIFNESIKKNVEQISKSYTKNDFYVNNKKVIHIKYAAYCGGTTIGSVILFKLKNKLPCMKVIFVDSDGLLISGLKLISERSGLPIVLLIDTDCKNENMKSFCIDDVDQLSRTLSIVNSIRHYIIFMERANHNESNSQLSKLSSEDISKYKEFYEYYLKKTGNNEYKILNNSNELLTRNLVTLRLLFLDNQKIEKIREIAQDFLNKFETQERNLLVIMYFFECLSVNAESISLEIVVHVLKIFDVKNFKTQLKERLCTNYPVLSVLKTDNSDCFKLINKQLVEKIVDLIMEETKQKKSECFIRLFEDLCRDIINNQKKNKHLNEKIKAFTEIVIKKKNEMSYDIDENISYKPVEHCTKIIEECKADLGANKTETFFSNLYDIFKTVTDFSPSIGIEYARFMFFNNLEIKKKDEGINLIKEILEIKKAFKEAQVKDHLKKSEYFCAYGDLLRHYISENMKEQYCNQVRNSLEIIYELTQECLNAYNYANKLSKNKNAISLIGECKMRKRIHVYLFSTIYRKNRNEYTEYLEKETTPSFLKNSETVIEKNIDILYRLQDLEETTIKFDLNEIYNECKITILKIRNGWKTVDFDLIKTNLNSRKQFYPINYFQLMKKKCNEINANELISIIDHYERGRQESDNNNRLEFLYQDSILSYIYLAQKNVQLGKKYHIDLAEQIAKEWNEFFESYDSYYYLGIFKFLKAINSNNDQLYKEAKICIEKCCNLYRNCKSAPKKFRRPDYLIGIDNNPFYGLILFDDNIDIKKLKKFEGSASIHGNQNYIAFNGFEINCTIKNAVTEDDEIKPIHVTQRIRYQFHIGIRRSGLFAFKYSKISID